MRYYITKIDEFTPTGCFKYALSDSTLDGYRIMRLDHISSSDRMGFVYTDTDITNLFKKNPNNKTGIKIQALQKYGMQVYSFSQLVSTLRYKIVTMDCFEREGSVLYFRYQIWEQRNLVVDGFDKIDSKNIPDRLLKVAAITHLQKKEITILRYPYAEHLKSPLRSIVFSLKAGSVPESTANKEISHLRSQLRKNRISKDICIGKVAEPEFTYSYNLLTKFNFVK